MNDSLFYDHVVQEYIPVLTIDTIREFRNHLLIEEKSQATVEKYVRDVRAFYRFVDGRSLSKGLVMEYKQYIVESGFAVRSINSMLASVNSLLEWFGLTDCKVKTLKLQPKVYCEADKELTKQEYLRLLKAAEGRQEVSLILQTIGGTGIRISELKYFTVEAVRLGEITVTCKGKIRTILVPGKLKKLLIGFAKENGIRNGAIFRTRNGNPVDRTRVWRWMKALCKKAGVNESKVFPHNLRKLFARTYYKVEKDIAKLADMLGHSSINTTRIYIMTSGKEHRKQIENLGLVVGNSFGRIEYA